MPSFDIVSKVNIQEVKNGLDQARREIETRYDFRDSKSSIELKDEAMIVVLADDQMRLKAMQEILRTRLAKRGVSAKSLEFKDSAKAGGDMLRQEIVIKQGIKEDDLKRINKFLKDTKLKVTSQIQGDQLRVSGKKKDELQQCIAQVKAAITDLDLQFLNFRD
ncbi:MAG: YajQ family cyclic di-GMP-binding protein [Oligoflexia bacterium]|nr:YajQ family cyclic di-GMP-binding protein [Oligoflexia bacterium]